MKWQFLLAREGGNHLHFFHGQDVRDQQKRGSAKGGEPGGKGSSKAGRTVLPAKRGAAGSPENVRES